MISRYLEYNNPAIKKEVLNAENKTILVFSRLEEVVTFNPTEINKLSQIFELLQEKAEDEGYPEEKETLYGALVDTFEQEDYFLDEKQNDMKARSLKVVELNEMPDETDISFGKTYSDQTLLAFGYLNSKDIYLEPEDLKILIEDLNWFVHESECCKPKTAVFIESLIKKMEMEVEFINQNKPHVNLFVVGL